MTRSWPMAALAVSAGAALALSLSACGSATAQSGTSTSSTSTSSTSTSSNGVNVRVIGGSDSRFKGTGLDTPYALPTATWTDLDGRAVNWPADGLPKPVTVVFFGYTHCPDVCATQLADAAAAMRRLDPGVRSKVGLEFVTVDPARDAAATMRSYLARFDPSFVGLIGSLSTIDSSATALGVALTGKATSTAAGAGGYEVGHGAQLIGFGPDRKASVIWLPGTAVGDLRDDLTTLAGDA